MTLRQHLEYKLPSTCVLDLVVQTLNLFSNSLTPNTLTRYLLTFSPPLPLAIAVFPLITNGNSKLLM